MARIDEWNVCPEMKTNFKCILKNTGRWDRGKFRDNDNPKFGKWIFLIQPKTENTCPTFGDQRNFFTGLFEAEWRNDQHPKIERPPQRHNKIKMFNRILDEISKRADVEGMERGIEFYIQGGQNGK
tara:strand:- start:3233 stop:3610 length:378 start_codon:yes stop_codon:yes gene_type:complete